MLDVGSFLIALVTAAATSVGTNLLAGKLFVDHWLSRALESHRMRVQSELDRITRIHDKEINVLPDLWQRIVSFRRQFLFFLDNRRTTFDLNTLSPDAWQLFVRDLPLPEFEKARLTSASERNATYIDVVGTQGFGTLSRLYEELSNLYHSQRIFLTDAIEAPIKELHRFYWESLDLVFKGIASKPEAKEALRSDFEATSLKHIEELNRQIKLRLRMDAGR